MANGLFMTPEDVQMAQRTGPISRDQMQNTLRGSFFDLGGGVSRGLTTAFGGDPRTPLEKRQGEVSSIVKKAKLSDPVSVRSTINELNQAGFTNEAMKLFDILPKPSKTQKTVVAEWMRDETVGNTTKRFLFQRDNFGFINKVGEVSSSVKPIRHFTSDQEWQRDINFNDDTRRSTLARLSQLPEFKSFVNDTDPEELEKFSGLLVKVANDLKDDLRSQLAGMDPTQVPQQLTFPRSDAFFLNEAYKRFVAGGGVEANINRGFNIAGADVKLDPLKDTTDPTTLASRVEQGEKKAAAINRVAAEAGKLVVGDPRQGQFRLGGLNPQQAGQVFSGLDNKTDEQIQTELEGMNFQFTPELLESHATRWGYMRELPQVTAKFINLSDSPDLYNAERARLLDQLNEANNYSAFAKASEILKYIERIKPSSKQRAGGGRFPRRAGSN
jgi:hypothetical protein